MRGVMRWPVRTIYLSRSVRLFLEHRVTFDKCYTVYRRLCEYIFLPLLDSSMGIMVLCEFDARSNMSFDNFFKTGSYGGSHWNFR